MKLCSKFISLVLLMSCSPIVNDVSPSDNPVSTQHESTDSHLSSETGTGKQIDMSVENQKDQIAPGPNNDSAHYVDPNANYQKFKIKLKSLDDSSETEQVLLILLPKKSSENWLYFGFSKPMAILGLQYSKNFLNSSNDILTSARLKRKFIPEEPIEIFDEQDPLYFVTDIGTNILNTTQIEHKLVVTCYDSENHKYFAEFTYLETFKK